MKGFLSICFFILGSVIVLQCFFNSKHPFQIQTHPRNEKIANGGFAIRPHDSSADVAQTINSDSYELKEKPQIKAPSKQAYLEAQGTDVHGFNPILQVFALAVANRIEKAGSRASEISNVFLELESCATPATSNLIADAVRAFCADAAKLLAREHPSLLQESWHNLNQRLDERVRALTSPL